MTKRASSRLNYTISIVSVTLPNTFFLSPHIYLILKTGLRSTLQTIMNEIKRKDMEGNR